MRKVTIDAALNGWFVHVGCQMLVYTSAEDLLKDLGEYMKDPQAKEKAFTASAVNKRLIQAGIPERPRQELCRERNIHEEYVAQRALESLGPQSLSSQPQQGPTSRG